MRIALASLALVLVAWCAPALAQKPVNPENLQIGLSTDVVYIRADFTGADLTIFGALEKANLKSILDLSPREVAIQAPLVLLTIFYGVYPAPVLDVTATSVKNLVQNYHSAQGTSAASLTTRGFQ